MFTGKHVLVTGGSKGIGRSIVEAFAKGGAKVTFIYNTSNEKADDLTRWSASHGYAVFSVKFDLVNIPLISNLIDSIVAKNGEIDILINNAGVKIKTEFLSSTEEDWDKTFEINLKSLYFVSQAVARYMSVCRKGKIINISSQSGYRHVQSSIEYGLSKSGVAYLTISLARILSQYGITVNSLSPGRTYTDMTKYKEDAIRERSAIENIPLGKINSAESIASCVLFLASESADNITGQILGVDGGEAVY